MKKRNKQKQKSVFLFCIAVGVFLTFLTCVDSDSKSQNRNQSLEHQEKQNPQSKIGWLMPLSNRKTDATNYPHNKSLKKSDLLLFYLL